MLDKILNRRITYWAPLGLDGDGSLTFSPPVFVSARWEDGIIMELTSPSSKESRSRAMIMYGLATDPVMKEGGYVYKGSSTSLSPFTVQGAFEIKQTVEADTIAGDETIRGVYL